MKMSDRGRCPVYEVTDTDWWHRTIQLRHQVSWWQRFVSLGCLLPLGNPLCTSSSIHFRVWQNIDRRSYGSVPDQAPSALECPYKILRGMPRIFKWRGYSNSLYKILKLPKMTRIHPGYFFIRDSYTKDLL